jgi:hypothetical protein
LDVKNVPHSNSAHLPPSLVISKKKMKLIRQIKFGNKIIQQKKIKTKSLKKNNRTNRYQFSEFFQESESDSIVSSGMVSLLGLGSVTTAME